MPLAPCLPLAAQMTDYVPVLVMFLFAAGFAVVMLTLSWALGSKAPSNPVKDAAYECGMPPVTDAHQRFSVKFYLVAILFVVFDIEVVFLFPWAVHFKSQPLFLLGAMAPFMLVLFFGWFYEIRKGGMSWSRE
jgi:NADH-quinone oxidoreductase subunit A